MKFLGRYFWLSTLTINSSLTHFTHLVTEAVLKPDLLKKKKKGFPKQKFNSPWTHMSVSSICILSLSHSADTQFNKGRHTVHVQMDCLKFAPLVFLQVLMGCVPTQVDSRD